MKVLGDEFDLKNINKKKNTSLLQKSLKSTT